jgi:tripartite-type tricarboxylate transporter receptor subunit TctC
MAAGSIAVASAADWPARPVRIVSPFAPGGTSDTLARLLAEQLTDKFGQNFFVENRGGAGGLIGSAAVASAEPDGGTFLISSIGTHVTSPATSPNPAYDPLRLFTHIAYLGGPPNVIVVHPSLGVKTFKELLTAAKTGSGAVNYISPGPGTIGHLVPELLARRENLKFAHVTYKGAGQAMTDLVAGHVKMGSVTWSSALGQIRAGTVMPLAVSSARPMPEFPDVPTMKVMGYPEWSPPPGSDSPDPPAYQKRSSPGSTRRSPTRSEPPLSASASRPKESRPKKCRPRNSPVSSQARSPNGRRWRDRWSIRVRRDSSPRASHSSRVCALQPPRHQILALRALSRHGFSAVR